jgi:MFS family permease
MSRPPTASAGPDPIALRRIGFAAFAGTTIEFYDFFIYGTAAALVFGTVFFPALGPAAGTVAAIATFAVAFVARPLGSALFGRLGDRLGRKRTLIATLLLMGGATVGVGLLPGAATIGVAAPIILVTLRFAQGLAVGGEWGGAALLAAEYAPPHRRGRFTVYPQLGPGAAFGLTSLTFLVIGHTMSPEAFVAWGWRVPFLLSVVLLGIGLYVRLRIEDTPVFHELVRRRQRSSAPILEALRNQAGPILLVAGALSAVFGFGYIATVYVTSYGTAVLGLPRPTMLLLGVVGAAGLAGAAYLAARWSDRVGRRHVVIVGNLAAIVLGPPAFLLIDLGQPLAVGGGLFVLSAVGGFGLGPVAAWLPELFAARYRYTAAGLGYSLSAILGGAVPPIVATGLQASFGSWSVGVLLSGYGLLGVICARVLPETRGRSLAPVSGPSDTAVPGLRDVGRRRSPIG